MLSSHWTQIISEKTDFFWYYDKVRPANRLLYNFVQTQTETRSLLWSNICVPAKFLYWNPNPSVTVVRDGCSGVSGLAGASLTRGISVLIKRCWRACSISLHCVRTCWEGSILQPRQNRGLTRPQPSWQRALTSQPPAPWQMNFCCF